MENTVKTCKVCKKRFEPYRPLQSACSLECAQIVAVLKRLKADADKHWEMVKAAKTTAQLSREAQSWVNRYVRLRDADKPCISCGRQANWSGQWHASHFRSIGSNSALRFHLWNVHKACSICNNHLSGNIREYAKRLPDRIGKDRFDFVDSDNSVRRYSKEYLRKIKAVFQKKCSRIMKKARRRSEMQN